MHNKKELQDEILRLEVLGRENKDYGYIDVLKAELRCIEENDIRLDKIKKTLKEYYCLGRGCPNRKETSQIKLQIYGVGAHIQCSSCEKIDEVFK